MAEWNLKGKKALVTGGSRGIGKAIVKEFLALGADVVFTARDSQQIDTVQDELHAQFPTVAGLTADVTGRQAQQTLFEWVRDRWGRLDILVNNAGINIRKPSGEYTPEEYNKVLNTNLLAPFELCRLFFPLLKEAGGASIVNVASVAGTFDVQTGAPYGMSKAGLIQMSKNLATEWAVYDIRVNSVSPWFTETPLTSGLLANPDKLQKITSRTPLRRVAHGQEMAAAVAFLAMDVSSYITGHNLSVDGGVTTGLL